MTDIFISARRGAGAPAEILYGTVTFKPTLAHSRSASIVLPAPTTFDLVNGEVVATNVQPTPEPVEGKIEWAYEVTFKDRHSKTYSFLVGVPDSTTQVNFTSLPRYFETKPPLFGQGPQGVPGEAATVSVGTVTGGTTAQVNNSGTSNDAVLDFVLPQGPQGPKGDGTFIGYSNKAFSDAPNTYPSSVTTGVYRPQDGWPIAGAFNVVQTFINAGFPASAVQIITDYTDIYGKVFVRKAASSTSWGPVRELAYADLATTTANGLMSSADKSKLDSVGTLAYNSKSFNDAASTYPEGTTTGLVGIGSGWPNMGGGFALVTTHKPKGYNSVLQYISTYSTASNPVPNPKVMFRTGSTTGAWSSLQTIMTLEGQSYVTPEQFGAKADGTTDDTAAIQSALDAAVASGKGIVLDGTKTYKVTAGLTTPPISQATNFSIESRGGIATLYSADQTTQAVLEIAGSPNGAVRTVTQNVDTMANYFVISGNASSLYNGTLYDMVSSQPWHYDPRTETTDARRSELHVQGSRSVNGITILGTFAESYNASTETLSVQPYHPMTVSIKGLRIKRDLPPVAQESSRHGLLRVSYTTDSVLEDVHLDGGTEYGLSLRNNYGIRVKGGTATNCNNYYTGYGISVAGSSHVDISGFKITNTRRGIDVTQGGKTISRYVKIHDCQVIGGGKNSRGDNYGWNLDGTTGAQQSGMGSHGGADRVEYYNNTLIRLHDPITLRGGNESIINNTVWGKTRNGAFNIAFGGGTIRVIGNSAVSGTETGPYNQSAYNNATSKLGEEFLVVYNSINPSMHLIVKDNNCEVQTDFIRIQDAQVAVPLRMDVENNSVLYRTTASEVCLINNTSSQGLYTFPASAYRWTVALNRQELLAGSSTKRLTKNINISNAYVLDYTRSGATT